MMRYSFDAEKEAQCIEQAVHKVLDQGYRTFDIYSEGCHLIGCKEMGERICEAIKSSN